MRRDAAEQAIIDSRKKAGADADKKTRSKEGMKTPVQVRWQNARFVIL